MTPNTSFSNVLLQLIAPFLENSSFSNVLLQLNERVSAPCFLPLAHKRKDLESSSKSFLCNCHYPVRSARPLQLLAAQLSAGRVDVGTVFQPNADAEAAFF